MGYRVPITKLYPVTIDIGTRTQLCCKANKKYIQIYSYGCDYHEKLIACEFFKLLKFHYPKKLDISSNISKTNQKEVIGIIVPPIGTLYGSPV